MTFLYFLAVLFLWLPVKIIFPLKKLGYKKIPSRKERLIIACNHMSIRDIFIIGAMFPGRQIFFLAKRELFESKISNFFYRRLGVVPVSRGEFDFAAVKSIVNLLNKNKTVGVFPEGTRNKSDEMLELKNGIAMFSLKTNAKIVSMYQAEKQRFFRRNYMYIGEAFDFSEIEGDKINKERLSLATQKLTEKMTLSKNELFKYLKEHDIKIKERANKTTAEVVDS